MRAHTLHLTAIRQLYLDSCLIPKDDTSLTGNERVAMVTFQSSALTVKRLFKMTFRKACQSPAEQ